MSRVDESGVMRSIVECHRQPVQPRFRQLKFAGAAVGLDDKIRIFRAWLYSLRIGKPVPWGYRYKVFSDNASRLSAGLFFDKQFRMP